jgi:hypothetical protein
MVVVLEINLYLWAIIGCATVEVLQLVQYLH